ncbi:MAG: hypothetical protein NXH75_06805 [Halobacteriovoraceae bacterium]|nr:hypothetical protein [Halobacteriovoraceae bacterium]
MKRVNEDIYWTYNGRKYLNKWELLESSKGFNQDIHFHYHDQAFSSFNWSREPKLSWDALLKARALQLRQKYDYIRLFYSGGVDSQTMLEAFIENDIPLDEILVFRGSVYTDNFNEDPAEAEVTQVALPYLESIQHRIPKTKITILETTAKWLTDHLTEDYFYEESSFALRAWREKHLYRFHPKLFAPFEKGLYHCDLRGGDKPRVLKFDEKYYMAMWDGSRIWEVGDQFLENFYLTPEFPELHSKQCHMVKNAIKFRADNEGCIKKYFNVFEGGEVEVINKICRKPRYKEVNLGKGTSGTSSSKQMIVLESAKQHNKKLYDLWMSFIHNEGKVKSHRFNKEDIWSDFVGILSKKYWLGD